MSNSSNETAPGSKSGAETSQELQMLKEDLERLRADVGDLLKSLKSVGEDKFKDAKTKLREAAANFETHAEQQFQDAYENVVEQGKKAADFSREQIEKRPLTSVFMAFLAGVLLGKLFHRR